MTTQAQTADSTAAARSVRWPRPASVAGRVALWSAVGVLVFGVLRLVCGNRGAGAFFGDCVELGLLVLAGAASVLVTRLLRRRLLWKVRNRLILTYVLMGLAPVVLFGTLTAIAGYIFAGQFSISSALAGLNAASTQTKSEASQLAGGMNVFRPADLHKPLGFDEDGNAYQQRISAALAQNGTLHGLRLSVAGHLNPPSPFDGLPLPAWLKDQFGGVVSWKGRLYLCRRVSSTENGRKSEVMTALELDQATLGSIGQSLGRVLLFSGAPGMHRSAIDNAEREANSAEQQADLAEAQRAQRQALRESERALQQGEREQQQAVREAQQEQQQAQRELAEQMHEASRDLSRAQEEVARNAGAGDAEDRESAREDLQEAMGEVQQAQAQSKSQSQGQSKSQGQAPLQSQAPSPSGVRAPKPPSPPGAPPVPASSALAGAHQSGSGALGRPGNNAYDFAAVSGGAIPPAAHLLDARVYFSAPLMVTGWGDGQTHSAMLVVISRPSVLYARLFSSSVEMGSLFRNVLVAIAVVFGLVELLALWMATRLSGTITSSVAELYRGTTAIDEGNLDYRVRPQRPDQLGALANSFNRMAGSIQDLLVQQRERDRLLNELAIAQEVQQNLFPHSPVSVAGLEMHAVCLPARSVSGDYFDFIIGHNTLGKGTSACIALGDISGKGISAALLMATLHSAVRAYSLPGGVSMPSPAEQLRMLNKHLFASTQPNRYATLFLGFYDAQTRRLTYANGGHLPPFLISAGGSMRRLEVGGAVVGLMEGMQYEEATVVLEPGDLLVAFTDGITEPENGQEQEFGEARLLELLERYRTAPLPALADTLCTAVQAWIEGQEQPDDMTLLLARQR